MRIQELSNTQTALIFGYGIEGQSSHRFLTLHSPHTQVHIYDTKTHPIDDLDFNHYDIIVVSPGISRIQIPEPLHNRCTSNTELFFSNLPEDKRKHVIGVTGTKGKSTTTTFLHAVLQCAGIPSAVGGNIGTPFLDLFDDFIADTYQYIVAELSSFQLANLRVSPGIALFLNLYGDHLDRHNTMDEYLEAKSQLWLHQKPDDLLFFSVDVSPQIQKQFSVTTSQPLPVSLVPEGSILRAEHFLRNLGTVYDLLQTLNIPDSTITQAAQTYHMPEHRLEFVATKNKISYYNDSISTTPHSTIAGIRFFQSTLGSLILCGVSEGSDYAPLITTLNALSPDIHIICVQSPVASLVIPQLTLPHIHIVSDVTVAVQTAARVTPAHTTCLFSPSAKSFDQFDNYQQRGHMFKQLINDLPSV